VIRHRTATSRRDVNNKLFRWHAAFQQTNKPRFHRRGFFMALSKPINFFFLSYRKSLAQLDA